ncbi:MAG TPA: MarR family transcriptional regulator [Actinospica sp.]|nr:MarR family transcriptional regulator [Actinospica sp.]
MRSDVAAFERLTQALVGVTVQSLDALDSAVTVPQFRLLRTLEGLGRVSCTTLAAALGTAASSVTRMVDKLEGPGYVARGADPHSRSIVTVEVTEAGREIVAAVLERRRRLLEKVLDGMSDAERGRAAETAERFVELAGDALVVGAKAPVAL